jgi:hypothetical protein
MGEVLVTVLMLPAKIVLGCVAIFFCPSWVVVRFCMTYTANRQEGILVAKVSSPLRLVVDISCWLSADFTERMKHHIFFPYNRILL